MRQRDDFRRLASEGRPVRSGPLALTFAPDDRLPAPRVAFGIPRAVGSAVARNRLRRRLREALRLVPSEPQSGRYLIRARAGADRLTWAEIHDHVDALVSGAVTR